VRDDPRDQLIMWLAGAKQRVGFVFEGSKRFFDLGRLCLTNRLKRPLGKQHKVEDWWQISRRIGLSAASGKSPRLLHESYQTSETNHIFQKISRPVICLHTGARVDVRRWPEQYFANIIAALRRHFHFHLVVIPEPRTPPSILNEMADTFIPDLSVPELVDVLGRVDLLLCNDSGPGHIAAACGCPVISIFGPSDPDWFRPWGDNHKVVIRDICPWRPCFDYCEFAEPYCMTKLLPEAVWPEIERHVRSLIASGNLPDAFLQETASRATAEL